jgi:dihydrofolate reductase
MPLADPVPFPANATARAGTAPPRLVVIAAVAKNGVIGANNGLPWRLPDDLKRFREVTIGHAVIMGRKTWETLPRALPERQNIVVTHRADYQAAGAEVARSLDDALRRIARPAPAFCIGGAELYRLALPRADELHLTEIDRAFDGDTHFPALDRGMWRETARESRRQADPGGFQYAFVTYRRAVD